MIKVEVNEDGVTTISNDAKTNPNPIHYIYGNEVIRKPNGEMELRLVELCSVILPVEIYKNIKD